MDSCSCSPLIYTRWSSPFYFALLRVSIESCEFLNAKSLSQFQQGLYPRGEVYDFFTGDLEAGLVAAADVGPVQLAEIVLMLLSVLREYRVYLPQRQYPRLATSFRISSTSPAMAITTTTA